MAKLHYGTGTTFANFHSCETEHISIDLLYNKVRGHNKEPLSNFICVIGISSEAAVALHSSTMKLFHQLDLQN